MTDTFIQTVEIVVTETENDDPILSHIIDRGTGPKSAQELVLEAMVNGTPLTALCGHTWVPSRDPRKHPICEKCLEIYEFARDFRGA